MPHIPLLAQLVYVLRLVLCGHSHVAVESKEDLTCDIPMVGAASISANQTKTRYRTKMQEMCTFSVAEIIHRLY